VSPANFSRNLRREYPQAVRGEGSYIFTADGRKYLDAAGGAAVVNIGHGVADVAQAMAEQAARLAYVHSSQFTTAQAEELAGRLLALAPANFRGGRVYFTSGGSEATETALKLCRQYWMERGETKRFRILSRQQSYHGSTLGALAVSGNARRREPFAPMLAEWGHIAPCYCHRCPFEDTYPQCKLACADDLEALLQKTGEKTAAGFIIEPVSGATLGAVAPPDGYLARIREICSRHDLLLIADEIMTGMGRTGKPLAVNHWNIEPDIILLGKGIAGGYAPLGAVLVSAEVSERLARRSGVFLHGFTYNAHPVSLAAGLAVLRHMEKHKLMARVDPVGRALRKALESLRRFPCVGDIRGMGLLMGIEFVGDGQTGEPFPAEAGITGKIFQAALERGVATYPMQGCVDGTRGDHILLAPPFIIDKTEIQEIAAALEHAISQLEGAGA
jgi:adenosylmethionine-8-amino-7-oxononanoate aminotransferase